MRPFHQLPPEIFYQIALHLHHTKDVLAFSLTNSCIRGALSTPALFKSRLELQGWDVSAWKEEDDAARSPGDVKRWMHIDHIYCRIAQLFDEATADSFFFTTFVPGPHNVSFKGVQWDQAGCDPRLENGSPDSRLVYDGKKSVSWLQKLSGVLPLFITHHRGGNIESITKAKYHDVFRAYVTVANSLCAVVEDPRPDGRSGLQPRILSSQYGWFEPICFSLIALLIQRDATTVVSIFTNTCWEVIQPPQSTFTAFASTAMNNPATVPWDAPTPERVSERYFTVFFFQTILLAKLHLDAALPSTLQPSLLAPSLPYFDARASSFYYSSCYSYYGHDASIEPGATAAPSTSIPLRPWLRDGLAGTPFASHLPTTGCAWAGYYTTMGLMGGGLDPPMHLQLCSESTPPVQNDDVNTDAGADPDRVHFYGEGRDGVGMFIITGTCKKSTGVVRAIKAYATHSWEWRGVLTPFGMAGIWGPDWGGGWWWIWPREWSPTTTRNHD